MIQFAKYEIMTFFSDFDYINEKSKMNSSSIYLRLTDLNRILLHHNKIISEKCSSIYHYNLIQTIMRMLKFHSTLLKIYYWIRMRIINIDNCSRNTDTHLFNQLENSVLELLLLFVNKNSSNQTIVKNALEIDKYLNPNESIYYEIKRILGSNQRNPYTRNSK